MKTPSYVYFLTNLLRTTLYIGVARNLPRRVEQHQQKAVPGFTSKYKLDRLIYFEEHTSLLEAITREKQLKNWRREKKEWLINEVNPEWNELVPES
jgi:putative endonuclease